MCKNFFVCVWYMYMFICVCRGGMGSSTCVEVDVGGLPESLFLLCFFNFYIYLLILSLHAPPRIHVLCSCEEILENNSQGIVLSFLYVLATVSIEMIEKAA